MGIARSVVKKRAPMQPRSMQFIYTRPDGVVGFARLRNSIVQPTVRSDALLKRLQELLGSRWSTCAEYGDARGILITVTRGGAGMNLDGWVPKFGLIYEERHKNLYVVFYIGAEGEVRWIAGPGSYTFNRVWDELGQLAADS